LGDSVPIKTGRCRIVAKKELLCSTGFEKRTRQVFLGDRNDLGYDNNPELEHGLAPEANRFRLGGSRGERNYPMMLSIA
jgi:hypothetical protein